MTHRIAVVRFTSSSDGWVECTCSAVTTVTAYPEHRKLVGARTNGRALGPTQPAPAHVVASRQRGSASSREAGKPGTNGQPCRVKAGARELFTGCEPSGEAGLPCRNCGRLLMLGGKRTRDGQRRVQHAPQRGSARLRR